MKTIDLSKNVHDLCTEHPDLLPLMAEIGFSDITKPGMLQTAGRFMTIPMGAKMKGIPMERLVARLQDAGFTVIDAA
jgi:hypothetical protein